MFSYNGIGKPTGQVVSGAQTSYGYDLIFRLSGMLHDLAGTGADQALGFTYNPASQIVTRTASNDAYASNTAYNVARAYAVNGLNQYTTAGPATFQYDANGNLTSDGSTSMVYDAENRLVSASGASTASLSYDPMGRLFQVSGPSGTTQFLWDGDELVAEYTGSGTLLRRYVHGARTDDPVIWYEGTERRSLLADHQGSIIGVANASGSSIAINAYDAWGIPNATNQGRFQYTGQIFLPELGLYHYKARLYSPTLGRFLQTDPVGYDDQINLYAYVGNDPVNAVDPSGMETCPDTPDPEEICVPGRKEEHEPESNAPPMPKPDLATVNVPGAEQSQREEPRFCFGPPSGPTGVSAGDLARQTKANGDLAAQQPSCDLGWFKSQVQNNGPWDYKQHDRSYQAFGNYNYGYTGTKQGIPAPALRAAAGYAQVRAGTSSWRFVSSAFDDPKDRKYIDRGIHDAKNGCY